MNLAVDTASPREWEVPQHQPPQTIFARIAGAFSAQAYTRVLFRIRFAVLLLWIAGAATAAPFVFKFIQNCSQEFNPPPGTKAYEATEVLNEQFPAMSDRTDVAVLVQLLPGATGMGTGPLSDLSANSTRCAQAFFSLLGLGLIKDNTLRTDLLLYQSYYQLLSEGVPTLARRLISPDNRSVIAAMRFTPQFVSAGASADAGKVRDLVVRTAAAAGFGVPASHCPLAASTVSLALLIASAESATESDLGRSDAVVLPIAFAIMALTVRSLRLVILPACCVGFSLAISFAGMYGVTQVTIVSSVAPSLMMSLCIAMSVDYSLFIMARYVQEIQRGRTGHDLVERVIASAGHTILVSGTALLISLLGLVFFPLNLLRSFGWGCALSIFIALVSSLTFGPAMLLTFPTFFESAGKPMALPAWVPARVARFINNGADPQPSSEGPTAEDAASPPLLARDVSAEEQWVGPRSSGRRSRSASDSVAPDESTHLMPRALGSRLTNSTATRASRGPNADALDEAEARVLYDGARRSLFRFVGRLLAFPLNVVVMLVALAIPLGIGVAVIDFKETDAFITFLPKNVESTHDFERMSDVFGYTYIYPYQVLFSVPASPEPLGILAADPFAAAQSFLRFATADGALPGGLTAGDWTGILAPGDGTWTSQASVVRCLAAINASSSTTDKDASPCTAEKIALLTSSVNTPRTGIVMQLFVHIDPLSVEGDAFYRRLLTLVNAYADWAAGGFQNLTATGAPFAANAAAAWPSVAAANDSTGVQAAAARLRVSICGVPAQSMDAIDTVFRLFPVIVGVSGGVVLLVVGLTFRSVLIPLRSIVSIAATEVCVFGWVVLVYRREPGALAWTTWSNLASLSAIPWIAPIVSFSVVLGIALDYDVFLLTAVADLRKRGIPTRDAVLIGVCQTGPVITSAGVIMAVAFFGMIMSSTPALNVVGMFLVVAVLVDTFIVRTFIVPTALALLGEANWWPRRMPPIAEWAHTAATEYFTTSATKEVSSGALDGPAGVTTASSPTADKTSATTAT